MLNHIGLLRVNFISQCRSGTNTDSVHLADSSCNPKMNLLAATSTGNFGHQKPVVCGVLACTFWFLSRNFAFSYFTSLTIFF